ncbi:SDR family NAD(P)-dependent oxidoreductase [Nonomuraea sp. B5E05]|uniref:SDR family NAD(P)-dependent oxidoreductase n=1 Tax=Nonomuraea sp. B5E05 TaxID=3153569 RepID=UPI003260B563
MLIGSVAGLKNSPANLYSATKWAVTGMAENLRMYATSRGVGVTLVNPGMTDTAFGRPASHPSPCPPSPSPRPSASPSASRPTSTSTP